MKGPAEKVFRDLCHKLFRQQGRPLPLMPMPTRGRDKQTRAQSARGLAKMNAIKFVRGAWNAEIVRELTEFPASKHDDAVDALALLGQRAAKMAPGVHTMPEKTKPFEGAFQQTDNGLFTTSTLDDLWRENAPSGRAAILRI